MLELILKKSILGLHKMNSRCIQPVPQSGYTGRIDDEQAVQEISPSAAGDLLQGLTAGTIESNVKELIYMQ